MRKRLSAQGSERRSNRLRAGKHETAVWILAVLRREDDRPDGRVRAPRRDAAQQRAEAHDAQRDHHRPVPADEVARDAKPDHPKERTDEDGGVLERLGPVLEFAERAVQPQDGPVEHLVVVLHEEVRHCRDHGRRVRVPAVHWWGY
eukprot:5223654-Prymnesium_polylepis.1